MYLRQLFRILFRTLNHQYDYTFDWTLLKQKAAASATSSSTIPTMPGQSQLIIIICMRMYFVLKVVLLVNELSVSMIF